MKHIKYIVMAVSISLLGACSEWLDLRPESEIVLDDYWQTESQATAVLRPDTGRSFYLLQSNACWCGANSAPTIW